ncbi:MAG: hypothetical protein ACRYG8_05540 [Janthinobacterium lividum]
MHEVRGVVVAGSGVQGLQVRAYADADMEAIRTAIMDAQVIQAAGRARGVNRTAIDPVTIYVLPDVALPMPFVRLVKWEDVRPDVSATCHSHDIHLVVVEHERRATRDPALASCREYQLSPGMILLLIHRQ